MKSEIKKRLVNEAIQNRQGDIIIAEVGAGATGLVVGKENSQHLSIATAMPSDKKRIQELFIEIKASLQQMKEELDSNLMTMAEFQLGLLESELTKTDADEMPSENTIVAVADWLHKQAPLIAQQLIPLFVVSAATKVVEKAGKRAVSWVNEHATIFLTPTQPLDLAQLRDRLGQYFNDSELRDLCLNLSVDYEDLPGGSKADKVRELLLYCQRHGRLAELVTAFERLRPLVSVNVDKR